jgi:undecaprenyl-diphosphatase
VAVAVASTLGTGVLKPLVGRRRPRAARRSTPSFPSGHATTGAAFATAVAWEWPAAGAAGLAASAVISAGRVRDAQHHVLDVVAGAALGAAVGSAVSAAAAAARRDRPPPSPAG